MQRLRIVVTLAIAGILLMVASPASAQVGPTVGSGGVGISVATDGGSGGAGGSDGGGRCTYTLDTLPYPPPVGSAPGSGRYYDTVCSGNLVGLVWVPNNQPAVAPMVLARRAYRFLPLPAPGVRTNPPVGRAQLVNLPTWLWLDPATWGARSATASVPGLSATVTAVPVSVTWTMGDGGRVVCRGPGTAYDPKRPEAAQHPTCSYTYRHAADAYQVTATTTWRVTWVAHGAPDGGTLPPLARSSPATPLRVVEVQAINNNHNSQ
jgi:hypothetical protein